LAFTRRTPEEVLAMVQQEGVDIVDFRFCDLPGLMQHFSVPAHELTEGSFEDGHGFDGSSIRGFQEIQESDMLLMPDPDTAVIDPFRQHKTLNINCFVRDPVTGESYTRDPRFVARKAEDYLTSSGLADNAYFGPEATTSSTRSRASGTRARSRSPTSASSPGTRKGISRSRPWTTCRTCVRK
jgi:glutamine synthetase